VELQHLNGVEHGNILDSPHACGNIVSHIAGCMRDKICMYTVEIKAQFSLMIDESTSVANVHSLIVYMLECVSEEKFVHTFWVLCL